MLLLKNALKMFNLRALSFAKPIIITSIAVISLSIFAAYSLISLLSFQYIPPGRMSILSFIELQDLAKGLISFNTFKLHVTLAYLFKLLGIEDFYSLKLAVCILFSIIPLATAYITYTISKSKLLTVVSAFISSFSSIFYIPAISGDYTIVSSLALVLSTLGLALKYFYEERWRYLLASVLLLALTGFTDGTAPLIITLIITSWAMYSLFTFKKKPLLLLLTIIGVIVTLITISANIQGLEINLRDTIWSYRIYNEAIILILLSLAALSGAITLFYRDRDKLMPLLTWITIGLVSSIFKLTMILFTIPILICLGIMPLIYIKRFMKITREKINQSEDNIIIEIQPAKFIAIILTIIIVLSPMFIGLATAKKALQQDLLGREELEIVGSIGKIWSGLIESDNVVAAPSRIAPWIRALTGVKTMLALTDEGIMQVDSITSTIFRMRNAYIMVDEWMPISSRRSPFIYSYDGRIYAKILHIDDGTNRMRVIDGGKEWLEDMYGMKMVSYSLKEKDGVIVLLLNLWKKGFNVTKSIELAKDKATLQISYTIIPNKGVKLVDMQLPVYIEGKHKIIHEVIGSAIKLKMPHVDLLIEYSKGAIPKLILSSQHDYVIATFNEVNNMIKASVKISVLNPKSSGQNPYYTSFFDIVKNNNVSHILIHTPQIGLEFLEDSIERQKQIIEVIDAFNRVLLNHQGIDYIEAPSNAEVLSEDLTRRVTNYKTAGLLIIKTIMPNYNSLELSYEIIPWKSNTSLKSMNITLWLNWDRVIFQHLIKNNTVKLQLDTGLVTINVKKGRLIHAEVDNHPLYKQPYILFNFSLNPISDKVTIEISTERKIEFKQVFTTRPIMKDSDRLLIYTYEGIFKRIYSDERFTLYKILKVY